MDQISSHQEILRKYNEFAANSYNSYEAILRAARPILKTMEDEERLRPPNFNIFQVLGHAYREVATHSAMLAHLLDPAGSHTLEAIVLEGFLTVLQEAAMRQGEQKLSIPQMLDKRLWRCRKEASLPGYGRVDILLQGPEITLVVENKIWALDQTNQLLRYWCFVKKESERKRTLPILVYLTPDGRLPTPTSGATASELVANLVCLSYREDISKLMQSTRQILQEANRAVSVSEILLQYANLIKGLG